MVSSRLPIDDVERFDVEMGVAAARKVEQVRGCETFCGGESTAETRIREREEAWNLGGLAAKGTVRVAGVSANV